MHVMVASVSAAISPTGVCRHAANIVRGLIASPSVTRVTLMIGDWQANTFRTAFHLEDPKLEIATTAIRNSSLSRNLWHLFDLPVAARHGLADIVHLAYPMPVLRDKYKAPIVLSLHDLYAHQIPENFSGRAWLNRAALRIALSNSNALACVSEETQSALFRFFPQHRREASVVIPNSIHLPRAFRSAILPMNLRGAPFFLCVAQHRANKNLPFLLKVFRAALNRGVVPPDARLVILGREGPETAKLHHLVSQYGMTKSVIFLAGISDDLLSTLYAKSDLVIAPSLLEGFGLPVAEALESGGRVVCSDIPAFQAIGKGRCVFFDSSDATGESFLLAIQKAREMPRVSASVSVSLNPQQAGAMYVALYKTLLTPHSKLKPKLVKSWATRPCVQPPVSERHHL